MLGINVEALAKQEIAKVEAKLKSIDADHDGIPDIQEAQKMIEEGFAILKELEAKVKPEEIAAALNVLFPGKFTAGDVLKFEAAVHNVATAIEHVKGVAKAAGIAH